MHKHVVQKAGKPPSIDQSYNKLGHTDPRNFSKLDKITPGLLTSTTTHVKSLSGIRNVTSKNQQLISTDERAKPQDGNNASQRPFLSGNMHKSSDNLVL